MHASNTSRWALGLLVLATVAGWAFWPRESRETPPAPVLTEAQPPATAPRPPEPASSSAPAASEPATPISETVSATTPAPAGAPQVDNTAALAAIQAAAVRYDASALPLIEPYLLHADPEVREAARDGMVQVGDAAAARYLRAAADRVKDPREAVALLDAADYAELPPALPVKKREGVSPTAPARPR